LDYIYAVGRIEIRFPNEATRNEFVQAELVTNGLLDRQAYKSILSNPNNLHKARQVCWILTSEGLPIYLLMPKELNSFNRFVEDLVHCLSYDINVVVGVRGQICTPDMCDGLVMPIVLCDQIYAINLDSLIKSIITCIPRPENVEEDQLTSLVKESLFDIMKITNNPGASEADRAVNYLSCLCRDIYETTVKMKLKNSYLDYVEVQPPTFNGARKIVDVIFSYINQQSGVLEKHFVTVDITEEIPVLVTTMSKYHDDQSS
jgi:hypothetical protein